MLFFTSWCKPSKTDASRKRCTYATSVKSFLPNTHPNKVTCVCYHSTWKCLILTEVSLENKKNVFLISYLADPRPTFIFNGMLDKKSLKIIVLHLNLATNS